MSRTRNTFGSKGFAAAILQCGTKIALKVKSQGHMFFRKNDLTVALTTGQHYRAATCDVITIGF